jgi:hypothetical protein
MPSGGVATTKPEGEVETVFLERGAVGNESLEGCIVVKTSVLKDHGTGAESIKEEQIVADADEGSRIAFQDLGQQVFAGRVQVGGGFVQNEYRWIEGQDRSQRGPFTLPVTQVMGGLVGRVLQAQPSERAQGPLRGPLGRRLEVDQAEEDIVQYAGAEKLVVRILEEKADFFA